MLKYVNTGVVFQEIPDEVTLAINISGCPCRCPGCHSEYLWEDIGLPLTTDALDDLIGLHEGDITCIAFMGGDAEPRRVNRLAQYVHEEWPGLKVAWYSGRTSLSPDVTPADFDYIKLGPYLPASGGSRRRGTDTCLPGRVGRHHLPLLEEVTPTHIHTKARRLTTSLRAFFRLADRRNEGFFLETNYPNFILIFLTNVV